MNKITLIKGLMELVEEERSYKERYEKIEARMHDTKGTADIKPWERGAYYKMRVPNNANIKDAMRIIGRLSFQVAKEGDRQ